MPFVSTLHKKYTPFLSSIHQNLCEMRTWGYAFEARMIRGLRKNQSLGDLLVRAKLEGRVNEPPDTLLQFLVQKHIISNLYSGAS